MNEKGEIFILTSEGLMSLTTYNSSPQSNYDLVKIGKNLQIQISALNSNI